MKPPGWFIQELAATTDIAPSTPDTTIGIPLHQCAQGGSFRQPYRYTPVKIASTKKNTPSMLNGMPMTSPNRLISPGHSSPIS